MGQYEWLYITYHINCPLTEAYLLQQRIGTSTYDVPKTLKDVSSLSNISSHLQSGNVSLTLDTESTYRPKRMDTIS